MEGGDELRMKRNRLGVFHHQVLRIREEESHLGKDIMSEVLACSCKEKMKKKTASASAAALVHLRSHMDAIFYSRPMLPSSPLGNNKSVMGSLQ